MSPATQAAPARGGGGDAGSEQQARVAALEAARARARVQWLVASEALFFTRPLLQVVLTRRLAKWRALTLSLAVDLAALFAWLRSEALRPLRGPMARMAPAELAERQRRRMCYMYYLLRAPLWGNATEPVLGAAERALAGVPLVGGLFNYAASFIHYTQSRHFYSEPV